MQAVERFGARWTDDSDFDRDGTEGEITTGDVSALLVWHDRLKRDDDGAYLVPLFADLKRHKMTDQTVDAFSNELLSQRFVERDVFQTTELWDVDSTGPYGHRGDMTTLDEVIRAYGGEGRSSRDAYVDAAAAERRDLIAFLKTLIIQPRPDVSYRILPASRSRFWPSQQRLRRASR